MRSQLILYAFKYLGAVKASHSVFPETHYPGKYSLDNPDAWIDSISGDGPYPKQRHGSLPAQYRDPAQ